MLHPMFLRLLALTLVSLGPVVSSEAAVPPASPTPATVSKPQIAATMMKMPLQFEANHGQVDAQVQFLARGTGYTLFLTPTESVLVLKHRNAPAAKEPLAMTDPAAVPESAPMKQSVVRMKLERANPSPAIDGMEPLPGIVNYFIGNDPAKWRTKIPTYAKVQYQQAYPGIDLANYGNQGRLEYDFIVAPGADPKQIKLAFDGPSDIRVAESGDLLLTTALGEVRMQKPIVYQLEPDGHKTLVAGNYIVQRKAANLLSARSAPALPQVGFQLASYDLTKPVVIDPVLVYSTYLGGIGDDRGFAIAVDGAGQAYVTGSTASTDFPTATPFQATNASMGVNGNDAFVTKLSATGASLLYSTFLGGSNDDQGLGIAVDGDSQAYVTGVTHSANFPTTVNSFQTMFAGNGDAFVTKLDATGNGLVYSTYLGGVGQDQSTGIAVDGAGQAYVTGWTNFSGFPTVNALQATFAGGGLDAFVTKFNATGGLVYSTYLGGSDVDESTGIAVDGAGQAYVTGQMHSPNFPSVNPLQAMFAGNGDAFVTKFNATGGLVYSTYLGGSGQDRGSGIAVDGASQAYVTGHVVGHFPTVNPFQVCCQGGTDAFVAKLVEKPIAHAGSDQSVAEGTLVMLDGSGSTATNPNYQ